MTSAELRRIVAWLIHWAAWLAVAFLLVWPFLRWIARAVRGR